MKQFTEYLEKLGIPGRETGELTTSKVRFPDGAQYRVEVPGIQNPEAIEALLEAANKYNIIINRITETRGIMRMTDSEIIKMCNLAKSAGAELNLSVGPRAWYDISAQRATGTPEGNRVGYRLRGSDQLVYALADVKRATDLGCRGILLYDEGFLWTLDHARKDGLIPSDTHFKLSAHCGHANPASIKIMADLGADSINPLRDLTLPILFNIRKAIDVPLDIHMDVPKSTGGIIRTYDAPEIVRIAAPVYLKSGASVFQTHAWPTTPKEAEMCAKQASLVQRMIERFYPEAIQSKPNAEGLAIPVL